jgi:DNA-binding transcriptional regulator YiaG
VPATVKDEGGRGVGWRQLASGVPLRCTGCGSSSVVTETTVEEFPYGTGEAPVQLKAAVPVRTCRHCGFQFTDHRAESARHEAVCRHLGVMTPGEVEGVRTRLGMTRAAFAELTRLGEASLARWEKGLLVQNPANDQLLYLLQFPENVKRLRSRLAARDSPSRPHRGERVAGRDR